jgi:diguanylate cyclase (GGDEF)-like protein
MSFRNRLTLFFVAIVVLPMIAVAVVLFRLVSDSEHGKGNARMAQAKIAASGLFQTYQERAGAAAEEMGSDQALAGAIRDGSRARIAARLRALAAKTEAERVRMVLARGPTFVTGGDQGLAPARTRLVDSADHDVGLLVVSVVDPNDYANVAARLTKLEVLITAPGSSEPLATTIPAETDDNLPLSGDASLLGADYRVTSFTGPAFAGGDVVVRLLGEEAAISGDADDSSLLVVAILLAFLVLAFAFALTVSRSLQAQVQRLLMAARRLGGGDFDIEVPTEGNDEFAALGTEFNSMARQLQSRLDELGRERQRLREAMRRVGEASAKGLDRAAVLSVVVETAVDGVAAEAGRATVRELGDDTLIEVAAAGDIDRLSTALHAVEAAALDAGATSEVHVEGIAALAQPLRPEDGGRVLGMISAARTGRGYSEAEQELFQYLASQAAVSIENVDLHETVQRQAVTDDLTGLFNHRRFQEVIATEVERARRFNQDLGLIMLDIDDFKAINDTYGHMQGDLVLQEVARVLRDSSREIDEPARYGGEEMAVALPQTDLEGAYQFAERLRRAVEDLRVPLRDGRGTVSVTASLGVAALPGSAATDKAALVAAADAALYRAKRAGKNRTERAEAVLG